ncbi:MAG: DUF6075 family protein [Lachnospiraceae bacterium]|nr:DUF6075 family protein [Lachnospiraceae bacterium]
MNTAERAEIAFISKEHEKFYFEKLEQVRYKDVYHMALCYCLGMNAETRSNVDKIYDFKTGMVKPECIFEGWQTSGSLKVVRMAFNLYCNGTPTMDLYKKKDEQLYEMCHYNVEDLFCTSYAPFFWQAIQIRYPEYVNYNAELHTMLGSRD